MNNVSPSRSAVLDSVVNLPGVLIGSHGQRRFAIRKGPRSAYSISGQPQKNARDIYVELISADYPHTPATHSPARRACQMTQQEIAHADPV